MRFGARRMGSGLLGLAALLASTTFSVPAQAQFYSETVSGDLSNNRLAPTAGGTLALGSNIVTGATIPSGAIIDPTTGERAVQDPDYLTFTVAAGQALTGLTFGAGTSIDPSDRLFLGIAKCATVVAQCPVNVDPTFAQGATGLLGWTLVSSAMIGTNVLPALGASSPANFPAIPGATGFSGPLAAGTYSLWLLDGDRPVTYSFSLQTAAVPEPATWTMTIGGFGLIGGMLRRRRVPLAAAL